MSEVVTLQSESDTGRLAEVLARSIGGGQVIGLRGDLGAGKTTLVRLLVGALGGQEKDVSSPSFTLENEYPVAADRVVQHWDLYRLQVLPPELLEPPAPTVIRIVEWPDKISGYAETLDLVVLMRVLDSGTREISFVGPRAHSAIDVCQKM
jgi:tRNA threonylcarbamoyladenosine biosynthesis protein TsaE